MIGFRLLFSNTDHNSIRFIFTAEFLLRAFKPPELFLRRCFRLRLFEQVQEPVFVLFEHTQLI
jgi:hypothetical protein